MDTVTVTIINNHTGTVLTATDDDVQMTDMSTTMTSK